MLHCSKCTTCAILFLYIVSRKVVANKGRGRETRVRRVHLVIGSAVAVVQLAETATADEFWHLLPLHGQVQRWGGEISFSVPMDHPPDPFAHESVSLAEVAYWPMGHALCLFTGATPASRQEGEILAAGPVNRVGWIVAGLDGLRQVEAGDPVEVTRLVQTRFGRPVPLDE